MIDTTEIINALKLVEPMLVITVAQVFYFIFIIRKLTNTI